MSRRQLTPEMTRILIACADGRLMVSEAGRYVIVNEPAPSRRAREALLKRGYLEPAYVATRRPGSLRLTRLGRDELLREPAGDGVAC